MQQPIPKLIVRSSNDSPLPGSPSRSRVATQPPWVFVVSKRELVKIFVLNLLLVGARIDKGEVEEDTRVRS